MFRWILIRWLLPEWIEVCIIRFDYRGKNLFRASYVIVVRFYRIFFCLQFPYSPCLADLQLLLQIQQIQRWNYSHFCAYRFQRIEFYRISQKLHVDCDTTESWKEKIIIWFHFPMSIRKWLCNLLHMASEIHKLSLILAYEIVYSTVGSFLFSMIRFDIWNFLAAWDVFQFTLEKKVINSFHKFTTLTQ